MRAVYGLTGCALLTFFNGWRSLSHPGSAADFFGSYVAVSSALSQPYPKVQKANTTPQILIFAVFVILYQIKLHGWNPAHWRRRVSRELQNPKPLVVENEKRRGKLNLDSHNLYSVGNVKALGKWIWVWLK
jgi:hypothetical protein